MRNLAVVPKPLPRRTAQSPRSASWTLYDPAPLAERLGLSVDVVDRALEETGFNKAVRIREEVIRWKESLRREERDLLAALRDLNTKRRTAHERLDVVREQLISVRNLLRIPREKPGSALTSAERSEK